MLDVGLLRGWPFSNSPQAVAAGCCRHWRCSRKISLFAIDAGAGGTDYIDLLLIHRPDPLIDHCETGAVLDALVREGRARAVGASNFRAWDYELLQSAMATRLAVNQIELSLLARAAFTNDDVAFFQQRQIPLMAWSPLAGGRLLNGTDDRLGSALDRVAQAHRVDRAAVAVAWLLAHPAQILPVLGTNNLDRI
ncbi:aldo/keto reductase [Ensifer aridi]|uniref:aldo/keto reductase n=1 Tax=Ensifer aridi TaxID=1708715 RepID=UPI003B8486EF